MLRTKSIGTVHDTKMPIQKRVIPRNGNAKNHEVELPFEFSIVLEANDDPPSEQVF